MHAFDKDHIILDYFSHEAPVLSLELDRAGIIVAVNDFTARFVGRSLVGLHFHEVLIDFAGQIHPEAFAQAPEQAHIINVNTSIWFPETFYCRFYPLTEGVLVLGCVNLSEQEFLRAQTTQINQQLGNMARELQKSNAEFIRANTALKASEEVLRQAARYTRNLLETSLDPMVTIIADGIITDVNVATEQITGLNRDQLIGSDFVDCFTEPERARDGYRLAFSCGRVTDYPLAVRHVTGAVTEVLYNASVYRNEQGEVLGVFASARDITERKRAEAARLELEHKLLQMEKSESLGRMAGAIAHLFNNLLGGVLGHLDIALEDLPLGRDVRENLVDAQVAARRASEVSSLMLAYLGQAPGKHEPLDLSELCRVYLPEIRESMAGNVFIDAALPLPGPVIDGNPHQIQQIVNGLISNAWEALPDDAKQVRLIIRSCEPSEIPAGTRIPADWQPAHPLYACLEVMDEGSGIPESDIERIFEPFFSRKNTGRGLGLAVVLGMVRAHQGVILVDSAPGRGSVFRVLFPVQQTDAAQAALVEASLPPVEQRGTVLLVDDDPVFRKVACLMLQRLNFSVLEARDGLEGLTMFEQHRNEIGLVLSDISMPRMDGWELLRAMRRVSPNTPVILSSGYDKSQVLSGEHSEWPQAFLSKPYRPADLSSTLAATLNANGVECARTK